MNLIKFVQAIDLCNVFSYPFRNRQWAHNQYQVKSWAVLSIWTTGLDSASKFNYFHWHIFTIILKKYSKCIVASVCVSKMLFCEAVGNLSSVEGGGARYHMWLIRMWIARIKKVCVCGSVSGSVGLGLWVWVCGSVCVGLCVWVCVKILLHLNHSSYLFTGLFVSVYLCVWATSFITLACGRVKG